MTSRLLTRLAVGAGAEGKEEEHIIFLEKINTN